MGIDIRDAGWGGGGTICDNFFLKKKTTHGNKKVNKGGIPASHSADPSIVVNTNSYSENHLQLTYSKYHE